MLEIVTVLTNINAVIGAWLDRLKSELDRGAAKTEEQRSAIYSVRAAVTATKAYLYDKSELKNENRETEHELAHIWQEASRAIHSVDNGLAQIAQLKALGYADPREWRKVGELGEAVKLDKIIEQCNWLLER
jgi:hypothetical protein